MATPNKDSTVPTEAVVELSPDATPFKNTPVGKTTRTLLQNLAGAVSVFIAVLLTSEELRKGISQNPEWGWLLIVLPAAGAAFTFLQNTVEEKNISNR